MRRDTTISSDPLRRRLRRLTAGEVREEAFAFIDRFHDENRLPDEARRRRKTEVARSLSQRGLYEHSPDELAFGARLAWRNSSKCIGRLVWKSLEVIDCRGVTDADAIAARLVAHLRHAHGDGRVRSVISIFAPAEGQATPAYVENAQLVQFAGYVSDSNVIGDPANVEFTRLAMALGWRPKGEPGPFDILPLIIRDEKGARRLYELPEDAYRIVDITHPTASKIDALGLRWYAVPVISDTILTIGGIDYPCAPFNGYYMATEIASRDLGDVARYDLLPQVADALGLGAEDPLRKDAALTELNRAVLHSFAKAGVTMVDHHTASEQFIEFMQVEHRFQRAVSADWSWIVPPQASSACPVFHMPMHDLHDVPNFYRSRATDGLLLTPSRTTEERGIWLRRLDRFKRWARNWWRRRIG